MGTRNHKTGSKIGRFEQCSSLAPDPSKTPAPAVSQNAPCCDAQSAATAISASPIPDLILDGEFTGGVKNRHRSSDHTQKITNQETEIKHEQRPSVFLNGEFYGWTKQGTGNRSMPIKAEPKRCRF